MKCAGYKTAGETNPYSVALLEEGTLKLGVDLVSFLLLLLEVLFKLVCGETHFGVSAFVWGTMGTQPWVLETLGCSGPPPTKLSLIIIYVPNSQRHLSTQVLFNLVYIRGMRT